MATEALKSILDRELSKALARVVIEKVSPQLKEVVNYSTNVFGRCTKVASANNRSFTLSYLYLHMIEMTDGIEVLMSNSCSNAAIPLVRSSFEALLSVEYILKGNTELRSLAWEAEFMRKRIKWYKSHNPSTPEGQNLQQALQRDKIIGTATLSYPKEFDTFITNYENQLKSPKFQPVEQEYHKVKTLNKGRRPEWYQLFGPSTPEKTPKDLFGLAKHLSRDAMYEILYREWSSVHHAHDMARFVTTTAEGAQAVRPLRDATLMQEITSFAINFIVNATMLVLQEFRPGEERAFAEWYLGLGIQV
jgi:hypothetical protein